MTTVEETIIDLNLGNQTRFTDNKHLFNKDVYHQLSKHILNQLTQSSEQLKAPNNEEININYVRSHHAILLNGDRGAGKTSILVNLPDFFAREPDFERHTSEILFLDPVDPTLLDGHEDFLNIVVGQINKCKTVNNKLKISKEHNRESYYQHLNQLADALEAEQNAKEKAQYGLDRLLSYQGGLGIGQLVHDYLKEVLSLTDKKLIVLAIDDVDMSLTHGFKVLEVVRKHLCSPLLLPIVSGDLQLYRELVDNEFRSQLVTQQSSVDTKKDQRTKAQELAKNYLLKVFPTHLRIKVPDFPNLLGLNTLVKIDKTEIGNLFAIQQLILFALNGRVNGEENSAVGFTPEKARTLMQWLLSLKSFLQVFSDLEISKKSADKLLFKKLDASQFKTEFFIVWQNPEYKKIIIPLYQNLSDYFDSVQRPDLRELCLAILLINKDTKSFDLADITYLNPSKQLKLPNNLVEMRLNETWKLFSDKKNNFFAQAHDRAEILEQYAAFISALPAIEPICNNLKFTKNYLNPRDKKIINQTSSADNDKIDSPETDNNDAHVKLFLKNLFSSNDYYNSYQQAPLIFFGRFFELITYSLINDINADWLRKLLTKPPYYSIISISSTKTFDDENEINDNESENDEQDNANELFTPKFNDYLDDLSKNINDFTKKLKTPKEKVFNDIAIIAALQSKYFNQINLFKAHHAKSSPSHIKSKPNQGKWKNDSLITNTAKTLGITKDDLLLRDAVIRAVYSYFSALGSFEKSIIFNFDSKEIIAHINTFSVNKYVLLKPDSNYYNTYRYNLSPFLEGKNNDNAFTKIVEDIYGLFNYDNEKYMNLIYAINFQLGQNKILKEKTNFAEIDKPTDYEVLNSRDKLENDFFNKIKFDDQTVTQNIKKLLPLKNNLRCDFLNSIYSYLDKDPVLLNLFKEAKFGEIIEQHKNTREGYKLFSRLIWEILDKPDSIKNESKNTFIEKLTRKGVGVYPDFANILASGLPE